jgi:hypothetical protein
MQNHTIYIPPILNNNNNNNNTTSLVIITCIGAIYYSMIYILNIDHIVIIQNRYINIIFNLILLVSSIISLIGYIYMSNLQGNHTPQDQLFYKEVIGALNSCNNNELARLGFRELGMDPTDWKLLSDLIAGSRTGSEKSVLLKIDLCKTGFEDYKKPINLAYVPDDLEEVDSDYVEEASAISDSFQTQKFKLRYNTAKKNLEDRKLPTVHIDVAKRYLESKDKNPELFHNFKYYWRDHKSQKSLLKSQKSLLTAQILFASTAASFTGLATGIYFQRELSGEIADAIQETGGKCAALNKIRSENPFTLSTPKVYEAGQCIEVAAQQEQFYGAVEHNAFWANTSMAMGFPGMAVMIVSGIALIRGLSNSGKN